MNIREMPNEEKPREKMMRDGAEKLSTAELIAIILGNGTHGTSALELASQVLFADKRGIRFLAECSPEELSQVNGMGTAKVCRLLAAVELGRRIASAPARERNVIKSTTDIVDLFMEKMRYYKKEHFISLLINAKGEIIQEIEVSVGDLCSSVTHPREVFIDAIKRSAGSVIFLHNHPSGDPTPSEADIMTTERLAEVGDLLGIPVLDHIIIGDGVYYSLRAHGVI